MKFTIIALAVIITVGIFVYTLSFARWLIQRKNYRGGIGVFLLGVAAVVVPMYTLFFGGKK